MHTKIVLTLAIISCCIGSVTAQSKLEVQAHQLYFNVFLRKPDTAIRSFVRTYFPDMADSTYQPSWEIYPPGVLELPPEEFTIHSIKFTTHPYFKPAFTEGRIDFHSVEAVGYAPRITSADTWFTFATKLQADSAFTYLQQKFDVTGVQKERYSKGVKEIAVYSDKYATFPMDVYIVLLPHPLYTGEYQIFFTMFLTATSKI